MRFNLPQPGVSIIRAAPQVCVALDTDFGILAHPDDCASLVPLLEEIDDYFSGDMRAAYRAMKARQIEFEYESRDCNWHLKADLSKIPIWKPKPRSRR